jgi:transcription termination/antitermination protein NusG
VGTTASNTSSAPHSDACVPSDKGPAAWRAVWTHSHCEQAVHDRLSQQGFTAFLPKVDIWSRRDGVRRRIQVPMLPGYLFLHSAMDKAVYLRVLRVRGVARVLGYGWDRLMEIPQQEIDSVRRLADAHSHVLPCAYVQEGRRVRMTRGPLEGLEGILMQPRANEGLLVISVHVLRRSVGVVIDRTAAVPV